jgi:metal-responsive CopG/Arc/MetJ family transcriptional regulator
MAVNKEQNKQILVTIPKEMVENIETFWHENKLKSRSEAIRELIKIGLEKK